MYIVFRLLKCKVSFFFQYSKVTSMIKWNNVHLGRTKKHDKWNIEKMINEILKKKKKRLRYESEKKINVY